MELNFKHYGTSDNKIIILHGLFGTLDNWTSLARKFSRDLSVFTVDQRNHGKSPHTDEFNYDLLAEDLKDFMDQHEIGTANVLGHSMGGKTAMLFAEKYPEYVERLIVADMAPKKYPPKHNEIIKALESVPLNELEVRSDADNELAKYIDELGVRQFLLKNLQRTSDGNYRWKMNLESLVENYEEILNQIELTDSFYRPVLILKGGKSNYVNDEDIRNFRDLYTNVTCKTIDDAGHWLHAEKPSQFYKVVLSFLGI